MEEYVTKLHFDAENSVHFADNLQYVQRRSTAIEVIRVLIEVGVTENLPPDISQGYTTF